MFPAKKINKPICQFQKICCNDSEKRPKDFHIIYIIYDVADILKPKVLKYYAYVSVFMTSDFQSNKPSLKDVVSHTVK